MNIRERIDKILTFAAERMQDEVASLLAADFQLGAANCSITGKADFFRQVSGKQVVAKIGIGGDPAGAGCLMLDVRDAIRLGGTLIMLPSSELDEFVDDADYRADIADSFGEIAGALCDALSQSLAENYPLSRRLLRQEQMVIEPGEIDIASSEPFPDQAFWQLRAPMRLAGIELGDLFVLLPARFFDSDAPAERSEDRRDGFDSLLASASQTLEDEFSSLLGAEVQLSRLENRLITKEEFCHGASGTPLLMTHLEITGEINGAAYLFCALKDAIHLGGTLIMLPPSELEVVVAEEHLTPDTEGAYGEIANMVAGVYSGIFAGQAGQGRKKCRLVKRGLQKALIPPAGDADQASPLAMMADGLYYQTAMDVRVDGRQLGRLRLLLPADLLELNPPAAAKAAQEEAEGKTADAPSMAPAWPGAKPAATSAALDGRVADAVDALIISDDDGQAERIAAVIAHAGMTAKRIRFKDDLYSWLPGQVRVIFLVMRQANEQAFSIAIKIGAVCQLPLVAVAPGWTRSRVLKAARYGVSDILASPVSEALISETLRHNLAGR